MKTIDRSAFEEVPVYYWTCPCCDTENRTEEINSTEQCFECDERFEVLDD